MSEPCDPAVRFEGVYKAFGRRRVWTGLDLVVNRGETLSVLGASGSGKSVLLKLIVGLLKPDAGRVIVCGTDVGSLSDRALRPVRRRVGLVFQGAALFDSLSVADNVAWGLLEHYRWSPAHVDARVAECLSAVGLSVREIGRLHPAELSGGMKKRVGMARAIAPGPEIILYDEPTTGLDPATARTINELICTLQQQLGVTSIVITHDIASAIAVSDRIGLIVDERIGLMISAEEAERSPPPALRAFMAGGLPGPVGSQVEYPVGGNDG